MWYFKNTSQLTRISFSKSELRVLATANEISPELISGDSDFSTECELSLAIGNEI